MRSTARCRPARTTPEQLQAIDESDTLHIAPYRADGTTPGTLTRIWSVVVDDGGYVRADNATSSRWYRSGQEQRAGRISEITGLE